MTLNCISCCSSLSLSPPLSGLHLKYQFEFSDLSTISTSFSLANTRQICNYYIFGIRLTSLLSTPRSSIRWFSIATWVNSRIAWLLVAKSTKQRAERSYYLSSNTPRRRDNAICEVWIYLRKKWRIDRSFAQLLLYQYRLFHCWLISVIREDVYREQNYDKK